MDREKQIEQMAKCCIYNDNGKCNADATESNECDLMCKMYGMFANLEMAGYRKQSEGKWEKFEGERFICSNCAKVFELGSTATIYDVKRVWKYCPNCGARMDGGGK